MKLLHFADAHIDMANYGRHDPESGLPMRVLDFLKSLDTIVDTAIEENVEVIHEVVMIESSPNMVVRAGYGSIHRVPRGEKSRHPASDRQ